MGPVTRAKWAPSGAWRMPVGDPYVMSFERAWGLGPFYLVRNLEWDGARASHQGADLGSGLPGAPVRAAAAGLVIHTADRGLNGGYGTHVVLAHRLPEGEVAYSVYAHLRVASIRVKPGQFVQAGTTLGRVGMTGRATAPHLHFEVRTTREPEQRWEFGNVEDPLAFIEERLPAHRADSTGVAAFLEWGEFTALLPSGAQGDDPLTRERWWRMLAAGSRGPMLEATIPPTALRDSLVRLRILASGARRRDPDGVMEWSELARDLNHTRRTGLRTGRGPLRRQRHDLVCGAHFGEPTPSQRTAALSARPGIPSLTDAVLLLADVAGPASEPSRPGKAAIVAGTGPRPTRADSLSSRSRKAGAPIAARPRLTRADSLAARTRAATASVVARSGAAGRSGADSLARRTSPRVAPRATALVPRSTASADSLARSARAKSSPDTSARLARTKPPADSLARRARATASADAQARPPRPRPRPRADSLAAPRPVAPAPAAAAADSSD